MADLAERRDRLQDTPSALGLPTDRMRPGTFRSLGDEVAVTLGGPTVRRLDEVAAAHGAARSAALLAAFMLLLGRYARVTDVSVTLLDGSQVVRTHWDDDLTFAELLALVRKAMPGTFEPRDLPAFQVATTAQRDAHPALRVTWEPPSQDGALRGAVAYDAGLFDRATVARFAGHLVTLLESALGAPGARLRDLAHTTAAELDLLRAWGTEPERAPAIGVGEAFLERVRATPDAVALRFEDGTLTYGELHARARHLAGLLQARGVTAESVVGLAMERSSSLVVAMLGVLLAGAAYLPLDSGHPGARLAYMVEDSGARLILTDRELPFRTEVPTLRIGAPPEPAPEPARLGPAHPEQQACVLYTSGSTGRPKGVAITHRGIVRLVRDAGYLGWGPSDVVSQAANTSFDAATFEIWGALLNGAQLVGVPKHEVLSPAALRRRIETDGITAMMLTTTVFHKCADADPAMFAPLRTLFFGGEAADARRVSAVREAAPGVRLVNGYGPTECTTFASCYDITDLPGDAIRVPIGRPIDGTTAYVLDAHGRQTGIGVPGELYLGGAGLSRGYVGRPGLTAERFVPSRFGTGERLYRTGDVARWREDGLLECLGRTDAQVKIRGVRIEPDEVAGVLGSYPGVKEAVVTVQGEGDQAALAAYVVMRDGPRPEPRELRSFLADRLLAAMVPTWYVFLRELPVTPNGKADLRSLPSPSERDAVRAEARVPPRGPVEELVAGAWGELLRLSDISAGDDFFALGGNSLLAAQAVTRIAERLGADIGVRDLFEAPTVSAFARRAAAAGSARARLPIVPAGAGPQPLSFAQQRLWFLDRLIPGSPLYSVPLALTLEGELDVQALHTALRGLVLRHPSLRTRLVDLGGGEPRQVVEPGAVAELEVEDLCGLPEAERERTAARRAREEAALPFDLSAGPLFRTRLLRLGERRSVLLLTMHHAVSDGWSVGVLIRDLGTLYREAIGAVAGPPPPLPVQYADYAVWQRTLLDGPVRDEQLAYWLDRLAGAPPALDLPADRPRPATPRHAGDTVPVRLPAELTARLGEMSRRLGATRFMILLAVFQLVLGRYAGVRDVSVGTPVSGRGRPELEELVGFFVNTLVLRSRWDEHLTFAEFLAGVKDGTLDAFAHQDVPFEQVVEAVRPPREPGRTPLFQVMMSMQDIPERAAVAPGLSLSVRELVGPVAKFDLTLVWDEASLASGALRGAIEYDVDLFERATVERLAGHFVALLESALAAPQARLAALSMLGEAETESLVGGGASASAAGPATLLGLLASAAARWGERTAVSQGGRSLSYAELAARSDRICAHLRARGVRPGDAVVVRMERSPEWPVALIGVMKAGACYVPVDAATPQARLERVLADSGAALVLVSRAGAGLATGGVPVVAVEDALAAHEPGADLWPEVPAMATAYALYTSGTTGAPKGVCVSQANLAHTLQALADRYRMGPEDRALQFASVTFDVAAEELFATLIRGGCVVMLPAGPVPGIAELTELTRRERLTVLNLPASYWHEWVAVLDRYPVADCPDLRLVVVGSERVDAGRLAEWRAASPPGVRWLNAYGPTEATITATVHEPDEAHASGGATVPIGRPLPGVRAYVLDELLRPVPQGVPGHLYLAGAGVAQGYLGDPARTAESFLPDPWGRPGERMYATGDRVRAGAGGTLHFLGRDDDQIKLRGFRIELGEVEAALAAHPQVGEAVAILREDVPGKPMLAGYAALAGSGPGEPESAPVTVAELREHLEARLPGYMVPAAIVLMDGLPRGGSGKIDRRALPAPADAGRRRTPPTGELERRVAAVWTEVLAVDHVGADENFFEAGGHSLLILRVQARLTELLGRTIPVADLFQFPTVRSLARHLSADEARSSAGDAGRRRADARKARSRTGAPRRSPR
ncbi:non-ribosomal peptide synthetase [Spongiactinospora rosea]|uniref:Non-ribosomal peptide synthetase n=1 Tax=Spongiactinospora rosea TaxID=2248750 RepID=A0A366M3B6_9ACTN|nr:non-ribosomal peptide synthetase [Spongiactinospora rosea]RBQ20691.1 non-ribosomal peptide synthetase [Spongiactinospora rosea]